MSSLLGSVGQGQELPRGACHTQMHVKQMPWLRLEQGSWHPAPPPTLKSLFLGTPWNNHHLRPQWWKDEGEGHLISCQGGIGQKTNKKSLTPRKGLKCASSEGWMLPDHSLFPAPHLEKPSDKNPIPTFPNQIVDFKFLPSCSGVIPRQSRPAAGSPEPHLCYSPSCKSMQASEKGGR